MPTTILIVDDEIDLTSILEYNLQAEGFRTRVAHTAAGAFREIKREVPDLCLLDLMLPDQSGLDVCKQLKSDPRMRDVPVIMLTARGEEIDRVVGFELGAEDYVVKPFSVRELVLRIRALLRRAERPAEASERLIAGILEVDLPRHQVMVNGAETRLTALEFKLLVALMTRRGRVQTREALLDEVWGITADVTTRTVDTHVKRLREKLGDAADYVETLRGVGYRFREASELGT
jgi:two-component system phosphate regulon response regulator PhoB